MNNLARVLKSLGLNDNQVTIYLFLLNNKDKKISNLILQSGINRKLVYQELDHMLKNGWVTKSPKWAAVSPNIILKQLEILNYKRIKEQKALEKEIHEWEYLWESNKPNSDISIYSGADQFMILHENILHEIDSDVLTFGDISIFEEIFGLDYVHNWSGRRKERNFKVKVISNRTNFSDRIQSLDKKYKRETRFADFGNCSKSVFSIYATDKMMVFEPQKNQLIVIKNHDIVNMFRNIFEISWEKITQS